MKDSINAYRQKRALLALDIIQKKSVKKGKDKITSKEIDKVIKQVRNSR